jgi:hypothetical protein
MLTRNQAQIAGSPGSAITLVQPQPVFVQNPPNVDFFRGSILAVIVLLPLSIALARRMWRRAPSVSAPLPAALDERLARIEQVIEATAIEVERIGEGQRFVTRLLTESESVRILATAAGDVVPSTPPART